MRALADEQAALVRQIAARATKPHPEFASPLYVSNLQRTVRTLADALCREIEGKAELAALLAAREAGP